MDLVIQACTTRKGKFNKKLVYSAMEGGTPSQFLHEENKNERKENHMKNFKKIMALLIAAMMVVGTVNLAGASALTPKRDEKLEVSGLADGDTVDFYKILSYNALQFDFGGWVLLAPFDGIVGEEVILDNSNPASPVKETIDSKAEAVELIITQYSADLVGRLTDLIDAQYLVANVPANGSKVELPIDDDAKIGLYLAVINAADKKTVYNPVLVSSDMNDVTGVHNNTWAITSAATYYDYAAAKKSTVGIKKEDDEGRESYDKTWKSTRIGETVNYTVTSTIPGYGPVFTKPVFEITDKLSYLKLIDKADGSDNPALVKPAGLTAGTDYTITTDADKRGFTVAFTDKYLKTVTAPTDVEIKYEAVVTGDAPVNINIEDNEVWLKFNHTHTDENDFEYVKDGTQHYTYTIDAGNLGTTQEYVGESGSEVVKVGLKADKKTPINNTTVWTHADPNPKSWTGPLKDAVFELLSTYDANDPSKDVVYEGSTLVDPADTYIKNFDYGNIKSKADGRMTIPGLDAGTYYLREKTAPAGFIKDTHVAEITIVPHMKATPQTITEWTNGTNWQPAKDEANGYIYSSTYDMEVLDYYEVIVDGTTVVGSYTYEFTQDGGKTIKWKKNDTKQSPHSFVNIEGVELPSTGGMGTTLFYAIGAVLVLGAGILLVSKRRMSAY
jgi:fimbrial isopeptide formation D2 family protein/LPXTG-motif cell wall-anchored protein